MTVAAGTHLEEAEEEAEGEARKEKWGLMKSKT